MDEAEGRSVATSLQLTTMGLLGILLQSWKRGLIPAVAPLLDRLQQEARFWIAPALRESVLQAKASEAFVHSVFNVLITPPRVQRYRAQP